jgi:hypothetical protein
MKLSKMNKIMVIQWDENGNIRTDIGEQKIKVGELIRVLESAIKEYIKESEGFYD